jgi:hypothetical protein
MKMGEISAGAQNVRDWGLVDSRVFRWRLVYRIGYSLQQRSDDLHHHI